MFLASRTSISARVYRAWTDKKCKIRCIYPGLDGWTDKTRWCAPHPPIHFVALLCRSLFVVLVLLLQFPRFRFNPSRFNAFNVPLGCLVRVVGCFFPRLETLVSFAPFCGHSSSAFIPVHQWFKNPVRLCYGCYAFVTALLRLEPPKSNGFTELVTLVTAVTPPNRPVGGKEILHILLSGNPDLSGPTAPQDSSSVRNAETESGVILTNPEPSGPIWTVPCSTEIPDRHR